MLEDEVKLGKMPPMSAHQLRTLIFAFWNGEHLTPLDALKKYGILALSQRCGELRRDYGWGIKSKLVKTPTGKHVAEYSL